MRFGIINYANAFLAVAILIPSIIYSIKIKNEPNHYKNMLITISEMIAMVATVVFMILPIGINKFGYSSLMMLIIYVAINFISIATYEINWVLYFKKRTPAAALWLAVLPAIIFLTCGVTLQYWPLVISALIFGISNMYMTVKNLPIRE